MHFTIADLCICLDPGVTLKIPPQSRPALGCQHLRSKPRLTKRCENTSEGQAPLINTSGALVPEVGMDLLKRSQLSDSDLAYTR